MTARQIALLVSMGVTGLAACHGPEAARVDGGASSDGGAPSDGGSAADGGAADAGQYPYFPPGAIWTQDVSDAGLDPNSDAIIAGLADAGGFGNGHLQIDFSIDVLHADSSAPLETFTPNSNFYSPDCDDEPVPIPPGGDVEGEPGYACTGGGDCHLLVVRDATRQLYEMYSASIDDGVFTGGCLAVWDLTMIYPPSGRGEQCTSADAAGYPIAPLLFTADEVAAGQIDHAIRFILPNDRIQNGLYLHPATHSTNATSGGTNTPPYGAHLRLRPDFPMETLPSDAARTVARALQQYGMFLADGGTIALTAQSDNHTTAKWANLLGSNDLANVLVTDFQMLDGGEPIVYTGNCVRNP